jgi:hypothetical protein
MDSQGPEEWTSSVRESAEMRLRVDESITLLAADLDWTLSLLRAGTRTGVDPCRRPSGDYGSSMLLPR